jgi:hypothetical protein
MAEMKVLTILGTGVVLTSGAFVAVLAIRIATGFKRLIKKGE